MKILIATKNKGKVEGAKKAFEKYYSNVEVIGVPVPSNVSEQPVNGQTCEGAKNRIENLKSYAKENDIQTDFYVSIESGLVNIFGEWVIMNIAMIEDKNGKNSMGVSPSFPVPGNLVEDIKTKSLGTVMDNLFNQEDLRSFGGGIQLLTHGRLSRIDLTETAFIMALTRFLNEGKWD